MTFAHDMRMGYARHYLQSDIRTLSKLNVGEEQSAMQNELKEISAYFSENLFSLIKQFSTFVVTVLFLLYQNFKLAVIFILPRYFDNVASTQELHDCISFLSHIQNKRQYFIHKVTAAYFCFFQEGPAVSLPRTFQAHPSKPTAENDFLPLLTNCSIQHSAH